MSQSITFLQFDEQGINNLWDECLRSDFSITTTQNVNGLSNLIRNVQNGHYSEDLKSVIWEIDDMVVHYFSKRYFHEYEVDLLESVDFWLNMQVGKALTDFEGRIELVSSESWEKVFQQPKKLHEIRELLKNREEYIIGSPFTAEVYLDHYLRIKEIFEYSQLTDTQMLALPEDRSSLKSWADRVDIITARALPVLEKLQKTTKEYKQPPFLTIPVENKEFFVPSISILKAGAMYDLDYEDLSNGELHHDVWASRVMTGETYQAAIQRELADTLKYEGEFQVVPMKSLLDQIPDNSGNLTNRYAIQVKLIDHFDESVQVMNHRVILNRR